MRKEECRYIQSKSQVPEGYVPLSDFVASSSDYHRVHRSAERGEVASVKLVRGPGDIRNGRIWVNARQAAAILARAKQAAGAVKIVESKATEATETVETAAPRGDVTPVSAPAAADYSATLDRIATALERIAEALESRGAGEEMQTLGIDGDCTLTH